MWRLFALAGALLVSLVACVDPEESPRLIENSTYRIGTPTQGKDTELFMTIFRDRSECRAALGDNAADECVPQVDRATGQVRLSFRLLDRATMLPYDLPLSADSVQVSHNGSPVVEGSRSDHELIRHNPKRAGQLFIVLIDGSGSMYENDGEQIDKVYKALLNPKVKEAFFPPDATTGVVLLRFTREVYGLDGGPPIVIENPRQYEKYVRDYLYSSERGFTFLYDAIRYSVGPLNDETSIKTWLGIHNAEPTLIAMTDGFNNQEGADKCKTNAPRLQDLLTDLEAARGQPLGVRPTVFTVGIGRPIRKDFEVPRGAVTPRDLCGRWVEQTINGDLERMGIDNPSMQWIAQVGGGTAFVKNDPKGLAQVFLDAAAMRYEWYTMYYRVDRFHHRQHFTSRLRLMAFADAEATVELWPSGWLDAPTGVRGTTSQWVTVTPLRSSFGLVMPLLGALVFIAFYGPAWFNARRAVFRRARGRKRPAAPPR